MHGLPVDEPFPPVAAVGQDAPEAVDHGSRQDGAKEHHGDSHQPPPRSERQKMAHPHAASAGHDDGDGQPIELGGEETDTEIDRATELRVANDATEDEVRREEGERIAEQAEQHALAHHRHDDGHGQQRQE